MQQFSESVEREYKEWEERYWIPFDKIFNVKMLIRLQLQAMEIPSKHTKELDDVTVMIDRIQRGLNLKEKQNNSTGFEARNLNSGCVTINDSGLMVTTSGCSIRYSKEFHKKSLIEAAINHEFIKTNSSMRGSGKTTALFEFAKEHGYHVVVNDGFVECAKKQFEYENVLPQSKHKLRGKLVKGVVFDDSVAYEKIMDIGLNIITGYIYDEAKNDYAGTIGVLKERS